MPELGRQDEMNYPAPIPREGGTKRTIPPISPSYPKPLPLRGQLDELCAAISQNNPTCFKPTWANEKSRRANLLRRPFQTHISTISVHDTEFSAKKGGPVASRPAKRRYHERPFAVDETAPSRSSHVPKCVQREEKPAKSRFSDGGAIGMQGRTRGCASRPVGRLASDRAIKTGRNCFRPA